MAKPIRVFHILEIEQEAFYFNNLADFTNRGEVEFSFVNFAPERGFSESMKQRNFKVYSMNPLKKTEFPNAARKLWQILKTENPEIVHTHLLNPTILGLTVAKRQNRRTVLTRHHSDALHLLPSKIKRRFYLKLERRNNRLADHIIAPSRMVRDCLVDWEGTAEEKVSVIPYGQRSEQFDSITPEVIERTRAELGMNGQLSLVCVSRLFSRKGHQYLFEAVAPLIKNGLAANIYLVGAGPDEEKLKQLAKDLGIFDNVKFLGWRADVLAVIGSADIIVHPSLEDALSQSLIESLMLARPIIATDISGARDTLDDGKYGKIVPPANSKSFRQAIVETIENLDAARESAKPGRKYLLEYMNVRKMAEEYTKIYRRLTAL